MVEMVESMFLSYFKTWGSWEKVIFFPLDFKRSEGEGGKLHRQPANALLHSIHRACCQGMVLPAGCETG